MAVDYTTTALLAAVRRRGLVPDTSDNLDDDDLLELMTEELQTSVVSLLMSLDEEHLVTHEYVDVVAGTAAYDIPSRAIGGVVRDAGLLSGDEYPSLNRIEPENEYDGADGYKFQDTQLVLVPTPTASVTNGLRISYHRRPSKLVAVADVATISAIDAEAMTVTASAAPPSAFNDVTALDLISANPGFKSLADELGGAEVSSNDILFTEELPAGLAVGDYVCLPGESPVPQCPVELHKYLVLRTRFAALDAIGDPRAPLAEQAAEKEELRVLRLLAPRGRGKARVLINKYGPGFRRGPRFRE